MKRLGTGAVLVLVIGVVTSQSLQSRRMPFHQLLHKTVSAATPDTTNVVFSPYSVATALTMLREAAAGATHKEISDVLGRGHRQARQGNVEQQGVTLRLWDALYYDKTIDVTPGYRHSMRQMGGSVLPQPFEDHPDEAVADVNADVSRETLGKVRQLLPEADPAMLSVLVSAVYFRAEWKTAFDTGRTRPGTFSTADGRLQKVAMMVGEDQYRYLRSERDAFTSVAIPYKEERFQMILVLPDEGTDITDIINRFDVNLMYKEMRWQRAIVKFPKFRVQSKLPLGDLLRKLGIQEVFTQYADLTNMSPDPRLYVSSVRHSATIETDEAGSEAAAATAVGISARSFFTPPTPSLIANRPFLFFVYDVSTANVLFSGEIQDAAEAQFAHSTPASEPQPRPDLEPTLELTPQQVVLGQNPALDREVRLEPDSSVETLTEQPGLLDSLQEVLGKQTAGRGGRRSGSRRGRNRGRGRGPIATGSSGTGPSGTGVSGVSGQSAPTAFGPTGTGPTGTGPSFTGTAGGGGRGPNRRRNQRPQAGRRRPAGQRRTGGRFPNRQNRRQQVQPAYQPPPPPPPPRRRRPSPPRRRPPPPPRPRRPRPPPRPRRPRPPPALPGSRYNAACNCYDPPIYPTAPQPTPGQRVVNINIHKNPTPLVTPTLWSATPTASIWSGAGTFDPLLWGSTSSLWPTTNLWG